MPDIFRENEDFYGNLGKSQIEVDTSPAGSLNDLDQASSQNLSSKIVPKSQHWSFSIRTFFSFIIAFVSIGAVSGILWFGNSPNPSAEKYLTATTPVSSSNQNNYTLWIIIAVVVLLLISLLLSFKKATDSGEDE